MKYRWWQRPLVAPFLRENSNLKKHITTLEDFLRPVLKVSIGHGIVIAELTIADATRCNARAQVR